MNASMQGDQQDGMPPDLCACANMHALCDLAMGMQHQTAVQLHASALQGAYTLPKQQCLGEITTACKLSTSHTKAVSSQEAPARIKLCKCYMQDLAGTQPLHTLMAQAPADLHGSSLIDLLVKGHVAMSRCTWFIQLMYTKRCVKHSGSADHAWALSTYSNDVASKLVWHCKIAIWKLPYIQSAQGASPCIWIACCSDDPA